MSHGSGSVLAASGSGIISLGLSRVRFIIKIIFMHVGFG